MIRSATPQDYDYVITHLNQWWGGRNMLDMLPKLFFDHFHNSSFIFEKDQRIRGFLVGFLSNCDENLAYIHFIGVEPEARQQKVASQLYETFIQFAKRHQRRFIRCVTSPSNTISLAYHHKLGFRAEKYDDNGVPIAHQNYDGEGNHRVVLTLAIDP